MSDCFSNCFSLNRILSIIEDLKEKQVALTCWMKQYSGVCYDKDNECAKVKKDIECMLCTLNNIKSLIENFETQDLSTLQINTDTYQITDSTNGKTVDIIDIISYDYGFFYDSISPLLKDIKEGNITEQKIMEDIAKLSQEAWQFL